MSHRLALIASILLAGLALAFFALPGGLAGTGDDDDMKKADRFFDDKTYLPAIEIYKKILADSSQPSSDRAKSLQRMAVSFDRIARQDEAIAVLTEHSGVAKSMLWQGRLAAARGSISLRMPHHYYLKDGKRTRGRWIQGGVYHDTTKADVLDAMTYFAIGAEKLQAALEAEVAPKHSWVEEHSAAAIGMSQALEMFRDQHGGHHRFDIHPQVLAELKRNEIGGHIGVDPQLWLQHAETVAKGNKHRENAAYLRYTEGMYCRRLAHRFNLVQDAGADGPSLECQFPLGGGKHEIVAFPDAWNPYRIFASVSREYKGSIVEDDAAIALGMFANDSGRFVYAERTLASFEERFPKSIWRSDCRAILQGIRKSEVHVQNPPCVMPSEPFKLSLRVRNEGKLDVRAYPVDLGAILGSRRYLNDSKSSFSDLGRIVKRMLAMEGRLGRPAWQKTFVTPDRGHHLSHEMTCDLDLLAKGAYLIEVSGEKVAYQVMGLVSELSMVRKVGQKEAIIFVADAKTGQPAAGVDVLVRQKHQDSGLFGRYTKITHNRGPSDENGLHRRRHEVTPRNSFYLEAFAQRGDDYALTTFGSYQADSNPAARSSVYCFTDRPVYRPLDEVHFVGNLRELEDGAYKNLPGRDVKVEVVDPKGNRLYTQTLKSDEYGAVNDRFALGEEPPLGQYRVSFRLGNTHLGQRVFRVEEYKKPEFEVQIVGPKEQIRVGEAIRAEVRAELYSGGGLAGAKVVYRVFRARYAPSFWRPSRYSWFYGKSRPVRNNSRELVSSGESQCDQDGKFEIKVETAALSARYPDQDHRFVVEADVTDLSRRTISGSTTVIMTRTALFASMSASRGFFRAGERATFEIRTQTAGGEAVKTKGRVQVYRLSSVLENDVIVYRRNEVDAVVAATNKEGDGKLEYTFDSPGRFVLSYVTEDKWGETVRGEHEIWITDPNYAADDFQFKNVEIVADQSAYQPGETAYLLINGTFANASIFMTIESDRRILKHEVLKLSGKNTVVAIEIPESFTPNVFVHAMMVQGGRFFQHSVELRVPPTRKFLDVDLSLSQSEYRPGELVEVSIQSRDYQGQGVPAQFALRIMDKAITYIQSDDTPDIRAFYYGQRRSFYGNQRWNSNTTQSLLFRFAGRLARSEKQKRWRRHGYPKGWWIDTEVTELQRDGGAFLDGFVKHSRDGAPEEEREESGRMTLGSAAMDSAASPSMDFRSAKMKKGRAFTGGGDKDGADDALAEPEDRSNFSDLAAWIPNLRTDKNGQAKFSFKLPDSLTTWVTTARGMTQSTLVGSAETEFKTTKNVLVRLQAPRFFTERDEIALSGIIRNGFADAIRVKAQLELDGGTLELLDQAEREITIEAGAEVRVDWLVRVLQPGEAQVRMKALSSRESDSVTMNFPVLAYGRGKVVTQVQVIDADGTLANFNIDLPAERRIASAQLEVIVQPSLGSTLLDAIPYLIEYPYGCTEQTMSRFMPAAIVAQTLHDAGISLDEIANKRRDLAKASEQRQKPAPIYGDAELKSVIKRGLARLGGMQNPDGGFGWWRNDRSQVYLTAHVLYGLITAKKAGYAVPAGMISGPTRFLRREMSETTSLPLRAYTVFALTAAGEIDKELLDDVFKRRDKLGVLNRAQLALACEAAGQNDRSSLVLKSLEDFATVDEANGTVHWQGGSSWWYWHQDEIETNAYVLLAFATIDPDHKHARPLAAWLVRNRSGNQWKSTRDTAACVLALARYMKNAGELDPDYELSVKLGNRTLRTLRVTRDNMFTFDNRFLVEGDALETGSQSIRVEKTGRGSAYVTARLQYFSTEEQIKASGFGVKVSRRYYRLTPYEEIVEVNGRKIKQLKHRRELLGDLASINSGDEIEVEMTLDVDNHYEYVMVEDRKPAGFEPLELKSGHRYGNGLCSNMELRDEKVVFFVTWLQQGTHKISYKMRAEIPGRLNAMPTRALAMYAPKLGGISDSWRVKVEQPSR
ncbi:MAG: MG2 domain-containing protein [Planctomycetota bacterium]